MAVRETKKLKVTLLSRTLLPVETIYVEWKQSRTTEPVPTAEELHSILQVVRLRQKAGTATEKDLALLHDVEKTFNDVIEMKLPLTETLDFIFLVEHCSIALREQVVRHRIGHKFGGRLGCDIVPDMGTSSFWSQSTRVLDMGEFASEGEYLVPNTVEGNTDEMPGQNGHKDPKSVEAFYHEQMVWCQRAYRKLIEAGVPPEDARNILPLATQHRFTWKVNLAALVHVFAKRGCWIAQLDIWEPLILGMLEELATRVHPSFRRLIDPPCISGKKFGGCVYKLENGNRVSGNDPGTPCSLYLHNHEDHAREALTKDGTRTLSPMVMGPLGEMSFTSKTHAADLTIKGERYRKLWGRDQKTGELLDMEA